MDNIINNISNIVTNSGIDIDALNKFLHKIGKKNNFQMSVTNDGKIIYDTPKESYLKKFMEWLKYAKELLFKIKSLVTFENEENFCKIINISNNCYLNSGLQILSRCDPLIESLLSCNYENNELMKLFLQAMINLLFMKGKFYNPTKFMKSFCKKNKDFIYGEQNCSQSFIRTILRNMNEMQDKTIRYEDYICNNFEEYSAYNKYIKENNIFPESKIYSIFSGITKMTISGECTECNEKLCNYSFNSFIDQMIYLNAFSEKCRFYEVLKKNIGQKNKAKMQCYKCKRKINAIAISKFVKIPEIFIFTLERYLIRNKVPIEPDEKINIFDLVDESLSIDRNDCYYELFAINIRLGNDLSFGHEICQIKENNNWYTINDDDYYPKQREYYEYSYGLFYRKIQKNK